MWVTLATFAVACGDGGLTSPPPTPSGLFTITFDDGWADTYSNAYPVLKELGLRGNVAVNPTTIDEAWPAYMSLAQVKTVHAAGWAIVSHSMSHANLTQVTPAELERQVRDSKAWIERNGFGPSDTFIVPFHAWGPRELDVIKKYHARARGYSVGQFGAARYTALPLSAAPFEIFAFEPEYAPFTTAEGRAATMAVLENAVRDGKHVDIMFHHVTDSQVPAFRELMRQIAAYKAHLRTWQDL